MRDDSEGEKFLIWREKGVGKVFGELRKGRKTRTEKGCDFIRKIEKRRVGEKVFSELS